MHISCLSSQWDPFINAVCQLGLTSIPTPAWDNCAG